jgi:hypothetical protein
MISGCRWSAGPLGKNGEPVGAVPVSTMLPPKVSRSTMAAHKRGSVNALVQPEKLSLEKQWLPSRSPPSR